MKKTSASQEDVLIALQVLGVPATVERAADICARMPSLPLRADLSHDRLVLEAVAARLESEERNRALSALVRPMRRAKWEVDFGFGSVERGLTSLASDYGLNLDPDFQRGHVWNQSQQERFIEAAMRGQLASGQLVIQFNSPTFDDPDYQGDLAREMQIVDGLQRLTAVRRFMANEIPAFGLYAGDYAGSDFDPTRMTYRLKFAVHTMQSRAELLQFYLDLNEGGTPHSQAELARVRGLLEQARKGYPPAPDSGSSSGSQPEF